MDEPTPPSGKGDGPVEGWVAPPRRGSSNRFAKVIVVIAVLIGVAIPIGALVGGCLYVWATVPTPTQTAGTPAPVSNRGTCTLTISADEQGVVRVLQPPYSVRLGPRADPLDRRGIDPPALIFSGTGWTEMNVELMHQGLDLPRKGRLTLRTITDGSRRFTVEFSGQWQARLSDRVSGCVQEVVVKVVP